jgi:orotidine-5'-phosphate decarboxylase
MKPTQEMGPRIIVALDFAETKQATAMLARLHPNLCRIKIGKELFTRGGPALVEQATARGYAVFLDLKFHDIPNTVAQACKATLDLGAWMINVHTMGGRKMLEAARDALANAADRPLLIGVTLLTSLGDQDLRDIGISEPLEDQVARLAGLAHQSGLDGVVCSAREARSLRARFGPDFFLVTPGIRPVGTASHDQSRIMSPAEAVHAGADYLVIGRPITQAADPLVALETIQTEINA